MSNMKAYTDIEQSKKLATILPAESADMRYSPFGDTHPWVWDDNILERDAIPCWSLAALLDVLPLGIYDEEDDRDYELKIDMADKMPRYIRLGDVYHSQFPYNFKKDTLLDNVVESIIWLKDNNYF